MCLNAGAMGRQDAESETLIPINRCDFDVAHTLTGNGFDASEDGSGRGTPLVPVPFSIMPQNSGKDYKARQVEVAQPLMAGGPVGGNQGGDVIAQPIAFSSKDYGNDATDNLSPTLRSMGHNASHANGGGQMAVAIQAGALRENPNSGPDGVGVQEGIAYTLEARAEVQAVAFAQNQRDEVRQMDIAGALAAEPGMKQQTHVAQEPYTLAERGREGGANLEYRNDGTSNTILTPSGGRGGIGVGAIAHAWQVRRLTVLECEKLQGFPIGFTLIETTKRRTVEADMGEYLADQGAIVTNGNDGKIRTNAAADGPRYKALGNSWAVPCGAWLLARLERELTTPSRSAA
jgi:site-specific DNA-cytosine methylase